MAGRLVTGRHAPPFREPDTVTDAAVEAGRLLAGLPDRWQHTQEVALHAWWASAGMTREDRELLVAAAYLHDIGYSKDLIQTGFHPVDGARYLQRTGRTALARLVAHHSGAAAEARHRGLTRQVSPFSPIPGPVADALTYSDTTTGPHGEAIDPGPRYEEIVDRHGRDSLVARARSEARNDTLSAVIRTLRRVSAARPNPLRFAVDVVLLGCATLIRPQGSFSSPGAWDALQEAVTRAVHDGEQSPHSLIVDTAQAARLPLTQLHELITPLSGPELHCVLLQSPHARHSQDGAKDIETNVGPVIERTASIARALKPHCSCP